MPTQCSRDLFGYEVVEGREVVAAFDGGEHTTEAGGLLLGATDSWSRARRVVAKAEHLPKGANPRFIVSSLPATAIDARTLYEDVYCARGEVEKPDVWTPPALQAGFFFAQACVVGCCYVSGLLSRSPLALMRSASWLPIIKASSELFGSLGLCQPRSDRHVIASKITLAARGSR